MTKSWREHRTYAQEQQVIELTKDHCQREIGEIIGLHRTSVHEIQRKYHLVLSFGARYHSSHFRYRVDDKLWGPIMEELYARQRLSIEEIGRRCHIGRRRVRSILVHCGFEIRTAGETNRGKTKTYKYRSEFRKCVCGVTIIKGDHLYCGYCRSRPNRLKRLTEAQDQLAA